MGGTGTEIAGGEPARYELAAVGYGEGVKLPDHIKAVTAEDIQSLTGKYMKNLPSMLLGHPESLDVRSHMF